MLDIINNIVLNKKYPYELLFAIMTYNEDHFTNISNETLEKYLTYATIVMSEYLEISEIKNIYTIFISKLIFIHYSLIYIKFSIIFHVFD